MLLKQLELNGFKSFAGKTTLEFPAGITAIVGPNGSGKSNIIDCIRWLLGEREARNLRGAKVEDLIWNGTAKKPRVGMARAGLYFDNGSGFFPIDYKEVAVSRKVARDGVSRYFLNKAEVRLKDIVDFFSRSRLGTKGLTIIGQGSSDLFVRASPEERRVMIEEILGLREYQLKKQEAERKLTNTFFNLEKARAMIQEVLPRLKLLKKQTNRWSKRVELDDELKELENHYFSFKLNEIQVAEEKLEPALRDLNQKIKLKQEELKSLDLKIKKIESRPEEYEEIKKIKKEKDELFGERSLTEKELGRLEGKLEFLGTHKKAGSAVFGAVELKRILGETKEELEQTLTRTSLEEIKAALQSLILKIKNFLSPDSRDEKNDDEDLKELAKTKNGLVSKLDGIEEKIVGLEKEEAKITAGFEEFNRQFQKNFESMEAKRNELRKLEEEKSRLAFDKERLNLKKEEIAAKIAEIGRSMRDFNTETVFGVSGDELPIIEKKMFKLRAELASIGEIDEGLVKEAAEVEKHYNFLTAQSEDLEKASDDLKKLIKELGERIHLEFSSSLKSINTEFNKFFRLMFGGGTAKLKIRHQVSSVRYQASGMSSGEDESELAGKNYMEKDEDEKEAESGIEIDLSLPKKRITGLDMLSGGERSLVSIAALFSLISVSPPPFLVLDEIDAALDESNSKRFADLIKEFSKKTQFVIATHNRATMEVADVLYGITMGEDGASRVLSLKLE